MNGHLIGSVPNFRDFGGLRTADGRQVRQGRLYRSSHLGRVAAADHAAVKALGIRTIVDFRGVAERAETPCCLPDDGLRHVHLPIEPRAVAEWRRKLAETGNADEAFLFESMIKIYRDFARDRAGAFRGLLRLLVEEAPYPLVFHCTAGKDRTGFASALILLALGVPREDIVADYLATNDRWRPDREIPYLTSSINLISAQSPYLEAALTAMAELAGSIDLYLEEFCGIGPAERQRLADHLLTTPAA